MGQQTADGPGPKASKDGDPPGCRPETGRVPQGSVFWTAVSHFFISDLGVGLKLF